uniref:Protein kinase cAMP-dependent type I regulatory subunit alpha n=1 Tax=Macaca mulatta TaxID=9544 RepID=A0A5F7ZEL5_MACMU
MRSTESASRASARARPRGAAAADPRGQPPPPGAGNARTLPAPARSPPLQGPRGGVAHLSSETPHVEPWSLAVLPPVRRHAAFENVNSTSRSITFKHCSKILLCSCALLDLRDPWHSSGNTLRGWRRRRQNRFRICRKQALVQTQGRMKSLLLHPTQWLKVGGDEVLSALRSTRRKMPHHMLERLYQKITRRWLL